MTSWQMRSLEFCASSRTLDLAAMFLRLDDGTPVISGCIWIPRMQNLSSSLSHGLLVQVRLPWYRTTTSPYTCTSIAPADL